MLKQNKKENNLIWLLTIPLIACIIWGVPAIAQSITTKVDSISVNFNQDVAVIQMESGYYDQSNAWHNDGIVIPPITVGDPAFTTMMGTLTQENALNLNAVVEVIQNSI